MPDIRSPDHAAKLRQHFLLTLPPKPTVFFSQWRWGVSHTEGTTRVTSAFPSREEAMEYAQGRAWVRIVLGDLERKWKDGLTIHRGEDPRPTRQDAEALIVKWKAEAGDDILEVNVQP